MIAYITVSQFLDWYFNTGSDQEIQETIFEIGRKIEEKLIDPEFEGKATITAQELWDECNHDAIPHYYFEDNLTNKDLDEVVQFKLIPDAII